MPTRPLPHGTVNGTINAPRELWLQFGRLASIEGRSISDLGRELIACRVADAKARGLELARDTRQLVLPLAACFVFAAGLLAVAVAACLGDAELRRPTPSRPAITVVSLKIRSRRGRELGA